MMQAVSLNLEPADLGPINVRIFMMDRTVHAHIRTDHMDLGQGMLNQQQQLETRLQGSGLEMGEFKVTVDQQQLSRGDSQGWLRHQGEGRPLPADSPQRVPAGGSQEAPAPERQRRTGIVSLFA
jgi:flagellar hook-length control protein FliK